MRRKVTFDRGSACAFLLLVAQGRASRGEAWLSLVEKD
jgi:hypothetical protein